MGTIKTFLLGMGTAYFVYFITRKKPGETSILDDLLDNPKQFMRQAKAYAVADAVQVVKEEIA